MIIACGTCSAQAYTCTFLCFILLRCCKNVKADAMINEKHRSSRPRNYAVWVKKLPLKLFAIVSLLVNLCNCAVSSVSVLVSKWKTDTLNTELSVHKEELIKLWKSFTSGSRKFLKVSSTSQDRAFFQNLAYISTVSDWIFRIILSHMYPLDKVIPLNFVSNPDPESKSTSYSLWRTYAVSDCSCLVLFLHT